MIATFVAIIVLVATALAAIALMRSLDTSNLIAGTMTFRQAALQEAELAYQAATAPGMPTVDPTHVAEKTDNYGVGYSAVLLPASSVYPDIPNVLVSPAPCNAPCVSLAQNSTTGNAVRYVIERLCDPSMEGFASTQQACIVPGAVIKGGHNVDSESKISQGVALAAIRLTVRVDGPKNTVSYVQSILR